MSALRFRPESVMNLRSAEVNGAVALGRRGDLRALHRFSHEAMATVYEIYVAHGDRQYAAQAAQASFDLVDRLERDLSRFLPNSDIARINHLRAGERTRVTPTTLECLVIARHMFDLTGGAFDVSIGTGLARLEFDPEESVVGAGSEGVRLDLGGIGKGYAVDLVASLLEDDWGLPAALVHGGFSSVLALEPPEGHDGWSLTLSDPADRSVVLVPLAVRQTALGASGLRKGNHIVDPRQGGAAPGPSAAWVTLPRPDHAPPDGAAAPPPRAATVADALTTACMLLDTGDIEALCARNPGLEVWILGATGLVHFGSGERRPPAGDTHG
jgi:thiamine biosynthesis lipoprotein